MRYKEYHKLAVTVKIVLHIKGPRKTIQFVDLTLVKKIRLLPTMENVILVPGALFLMEPVRVAYTHPFKEFVHLIKLLLIKEHVQHVCKVACLILLKRNVLMAMVSSVLL